MPAPRTPPADLRGKTCLVTGATSGIGRATAIGLAELGARVAVVARDAARGSALAEELEARRRATGASTQSPAEGGPLLFVADVSQQAEVRHLARQIEERISRLDVLVNNAAVITRRRASTADGLETQLAVNHLAPFLLTRLLLGLLRRSAPARIVNVASQVESQGRIDFEDLGRERSYDPLDAYRQSKLANVLFTYELARRIEGSGVTVNCLHPGVIATRLLDDFLGRPRALGFVTRMQYPDASEGARTSIFLASSHEVEDVNGRYFRECAEARSSPASRDRALAERLWRVSSELTGLDPEEKT